MKLEQTLRLVPTRAQSTSTQEVVWQQGLPTGIEGEGQKITMRPATHGSSSFRSSRSRATCFNPCSSRCFKFVGVLVQTNFRRRARQPQPRSRHHLRATHSILAEAKHPGVTLKKNKRRLQL